MIHHTTGGGLTLVAITRVWKAILMSKKKKWGIPETELGRIVMIVHEGIISWHYKPPSNFVRKASVPTGQGVYANLPDGEKLYARARRRINKYSLELLTTKKLPDWLITINYPYRYADILTSEMLKLDLKCLRKFVSRNFSDAGFSYSIDWSPKAKHHVHMLVWDDSLKQEADPQKRGEKLLTLFRRWWLKRVKSTKSKLVDVKHLPTDGDSIRARSYLVSSKKVIAHMPVVALLGRKHGFGFFNKKNIPFALGEVVELSLEEFEEIREMMLADLSTSKNSSKSAQTKRHKRKLKKAKSHRHRCHDRKLAKRIKNKLRKRNREM